MFQKKKKQVHLTKEFGGIGTINTDYFQGLSSELCASVRSKQMTEMVLKTCTS